MRKNLCCFLWAAPSEYAGFFCASCFLLMALDIIPEAFGRLLFAIGFITYLCLMNNYRRDHREECRIWDERLKSVEKSVSCWSIPPPRLPIDEPESPAAADNCK